MLYGRRISFEMEIVQVPVGILLYGGNVHVPRVSSVTGENGSFALHYEVARSDSYISTGMLEINRTTNGTRNKKKDCRSPLNLVMHDRIFYPLPTHLVYCSQCRYLTQVQLQRQLVCIL